jgi:hypothetical protein
LILPSMILLSSIEEWMSRLLRRKSRDERGDPERPQRHAR